MSRAGVALLWGVFAFVAWNVVFDRHVTSAALEFTRTQVERHHEGEHGASLHTEFSPRVRDAAARASLWVSPILVAGALAIYVHARRKP